MRYYRCGACGFIFTEAPYWLDEAYSSAMTSIDIGPVARCFEGAQKIAALILAAHDHRGRFLDFGGGYGLFCRRMRDLGFDFLHYDTHCENIFAKQHAFRMEEGGRFEVVTAFEVVEHLTEPMTVFELILSMTDSFCISTVLVPDPAPRVTKWWYYGPEHGQHIAFYTKESLRHIAERFGCHLHSVGDMHLLTRRSVSPRSFRWAMDARLARLMTALLGRRKGRSLAPPKGFRESQWPPAPQGEIPQGLTAHRYVEVSPHLRHQRPGRRVPGPVPGVQGLPRPWHLP
ncbi:MAG: class I SAM-dependent methyltransferase [Betaproteobacteria bacterium]|nr:class I SAM-dependent methyltransferase [Betaproteobacteria bacterium]